MAGQYARLQRYATADRGDMSTTRRGELVDVLISFGYTRDHAVGIVWATNLNESDSDAEALTKVLTEGEDNRGNRETIVPGSPTVIALRPAAQSQDNIIADTTPLPPPPPDTTPAPLGHRLSALFANPRGYSPSVLAQTPPPTGPGPGPSPDDESVDATTLAQAQTVLAQNRAATAAAAATAGAGHPALPNSAAQFADRWAASVQPQFERLNDWASNLPTPGGIGLMLILIAFFLFAVVPVNGTQTRLSLLFLTLLGHTTLPTPQKPWQAVPNNPIAAALEGMATATEDIAASISGVTGAVNTAGGIAGGIGAGIGAGLGTASGGLLAATGVVGQGMQNYLHGASGGLLSFNYGEDGFIPLSPAGPGPGPVPGVQTY